MSDTEQNELDNAYDLDKNYELAKGIVGDVLNDKPADAVDKMNDIMMDKVRDTIAAKRIEVAQSLMNPQSEEDSEVEYEDDDATEVDDSDIETETEEEDGEDVQGDL